MARDDMKWTFPAAASTTNKSDSLDLGHRTIARLYIPAMEATTAGLRFETTQDGPTVLDADATWDPVLVDDNDNVVEIPASASAVKVVSITSPDVFSGVRRVRLAAVSGAAAAVNQDGQVVVPELVEV